MESNLNLFYCYCGSIQGKVKMVTHDVYLFRNITGHTVGHSTTFELQFFICGVILFTVDKLLCLVRVIYPNLET